MAKSDKALIQQAYDTIYNYLMNRSEGKETYNALWKKDEKINGAWFCPADSELFNLLYVLRDNIRLAKAKDNGNGNLHKVIESLIKHQDNSRPAIVGIYEHENGYTYYTDSYIMFKTEEKLELPRCCQHGEQPLDYERILKMSDTRFMREVHVPTTAELKQYIKLNKNASDVKDGTTLIYFLRNENGEAIAAFNAKFIEQCREGIGDNAKCYVSKDKARVSPMVMVTDKTTALVVPCMPSWGWERKEDNWETVA